MGLEGNLEGEDRATQARISTSRREGRPNERIVTSEIKGVLRNESGPQEASQRGKQDIEKKDISERASALES